MGSYNGVIQWSHIVDAGFPDGKLSLRRSQRSTNHLAINSEPGEAQKLPPNH